MKAIKAKASFQSQYDWHRTALSDSTITFSGIRAEVANYEMAHLFILTCAFYLADALIPKP